MIGDTSVLAGHDVVLRMIRRLRNLYGVAVIRGSKLLVGRPLWSPAYKHWTGPQEKLFTSFAQANAWASREL